MKDLLKKWVNGTATWSEEKKLRQAAEQDHFLAEAMEGYDTFPVNDHAAKIAQLKGRFRKSQTEEKRAVFPFSRVAAAAAIIGVIGTLFWVQRAVEAPTILSQKAEKIELPSPQNSFDNNSIQEKNIREEAAGIEEIAANTTIPKENKKSRENTVAKPKVKKSIKSKQPTSPQKKSETYTAPPSTPINDATLADNSEVIETDVSAIVTLAESADIVSTSETSATKTEIIATTETEATSAPAASPISASPTPASPIEYADTRARSVRKSKVTPPIEKINYYVGQVQNEDGQPLHDVKIIGLNTAFKTTTTLKGDFVLEADQPLNKIAVSKDGFHTRKIAINQYSDFLNVSLVEKSTTIPSADLTMETIAPKPVEGLVNFFKYLAEHRIYPKGAKAKGIERDVEIRFYIDENGTPTDLKVTNPDIYGFDKEAIRLLKEGPKWQPANSHARYYVPFELE